MITLNDVIANLNDNYTQITDLFVNKYNFADEPSYWTNPNTPNFDFYGWADVVFIQSDNKVAIAGVSGLYDSDLDEDYTIAKRFNTNGSLDGTFTSAKFHGNYSGYIRDIGQQSDGKLIVVGHFESVDGNSSNRIARLNTDGTLDNTFSVGAGFNYNVFCCKVLSDDSILVGGAFSNYDGYGNSRILKLNSDGTINTAFADNVSLNGNVHAIAVDGDGYIYVGGNFSNRIIKLGADGTTDGSFSPGNGFNDRVTSIDIQGDGKIIVGGWFDYYDNSSCNPCVVRLNTDGTLDGSFVSDGTGLNFWDGLGVQALKLQSDGKIIAGGWFIGYNDTVQRAIVRLNDDGTRDDTFVIGTGFSDRVQDIKIDSSGNILVAGLFYYYNGKPCSSEFNYLDSKQSGGFARLSSTGLLLGTSVHQDILPIGIQDGNHDMFDDGLYINTDLNQPYPDIYGGASLPFTHSVLFYADSSEGINFTTYDISTDNYSFDATAMDGFVAVREDIFGAGSLYFTNMYPGLFVMGADNVSIGEISLCGGIGKDGNGGYDSGSFDISIGGKNYGIFYKSTYGNDGDYETNIQQIIIIDRTSEGASQDFYDPLDSMEQVLTRISGTKKVFMLVFACTNIYNPLTQIDISAIAIKFLNVAMTERVKVVPRRPINPKLTLKVKTYDPVKLQTQMLPDSNRENIINQLKNQTVWLPNWSYPLKDGDIISLNGQQAVQLYKDIPYLNNKEFNVVEVLYYGPDIVEAPTKEVYIFINNNYVDYVSDPGTRASHEANNLMFYMSSVSIKYKTFTGIDAPSWSDVSSKANVIIIPELEEASLLPDLTSNAQSKISEFVDKGGKLIMFYPTSEVTDLLNSVFGFSIGGEGGAGEPINLTGAGASMFTGLEGTIPYWSATSSVDSSTLPVSSVVIYEGSGSNQSVVTKIPYGNGAIYILGWDWYDAAPQGENDGGWNFLLKSIIEK